MSWIKISQYCTVCRVEALLLCPGLEYLSTVLCVELRHCCCVLEKNILVLYSVCTLEASLLCPGLEYLSTVLCVELRHPCCVLDKNTLVLYCV